MDVTYCLENAQMEQFPAIFSGACVEGAGRLKELYPRQETHQVIYETVLTEPEATCDISFRVDTGEKPVQDYWLEFDYAVYAAEDGATTPCKFLDASCLKPKRDPEAVQHFLEQDLVELVGQEKAALLAAPLLDLADKLRGKCSGLFQVGSMDSRTASSSVRIYTQPMKADDTLALLEDLSWAGDPEPARRMMEEASPYAPTWGFTLSFDLFADHISERIGIEFHPLQAKPEKVRPLLDKLVGVWDCLPQKCDAVMEWMLAKPIPETMLQNDISHIKFNLEGGAVRTVKAYLRQSDEALGLAPYHRALRHPVMMNLELTTRCPLRCPQCYVHLNTGEDMELDTALYWLREGKKAGIQLACLSGGETLCYPHLSELIRACKELGITSAIALSGIYASKERLEGLIADGVDDIFISLNGSTEEINRKTRDGYQLAINALKTLRELEFGSTNINWVMNKENAHDFMGMVALAERYQVKQLAILAFKPDSAYEWRRFPSAAQLEEVARQIKAYRGPVKIMTEPCFSQMNALLGRSALLGNRNVGIQKGCRSGRDQISVSVDGRLTPCRHLDVRETFDTIMEYWETSSFLKQLRTVEDERREPCLGCQFENNCLPCMAVGYKLEGEVTHGLATCELCKL